MIEAEVQERLPELSHEERFQALRLLRMLKAGQLEAVTATMHRKDEVMLLEGRRHPIRYKCRG